MRRMISNNIASKLAVQDGRLGTIVEVPGTPLTSYDDIQIGETYHIVVPAGKSFQTEEFIYGIISNVNGPVVSREGGMPNAGLGCSLGFKSFNLTLSETSGIEFNQAFECDIQVTQVRTDTGGAPFNDDLFQYLYTPATKVFKAFKLED